MKTLMNNFSKPQSQFWKPQWNNWYTPIIGIPQLKYPNGNDENPNGNLNPNESSKLPIMSDSSTPENILYNTVYAYGGSGLHF